MQEREQLTTADLAGRTEDGGPEIADEDRELTAARAEVGDDRQRTGAGEDTEPLLDHGEADRFQERWRGIQGDFVDRPREAVQEADRLVADLMQRLAAQFSETRSGLEHQWDRDDDVSTEDLRVALTRYRSFFERLLSA
jgi:hypothetical protein